MEQKLSDSIKETIQSGCIRKKYTVAKSSLKSDAREICENFQYKLAMYFNELEGGTKIYLVSPVGGGGL